MNDNNNFYVLTGGPGVGKTSVLNGLRRRGFLCIDEVAREIIRSEMERGGDALPWGNIPDYTRKMLHASVAVYINCKNIEEICFFDRGIPDTLAYARLTGQEEQEIRKITTEYKYNPAVFLFPPWQEIYQTDAERKQDFAEAVRTYEIMKDVYRECGYTIVEVPRMPVEERCDFILEHTCAWLKSYL
ncbi:MAG: AAA family ATPase [Tannerellaceae bacterium]|nr:AAA family ATPase [Tannerellaceae bacterium]